VTQRIDRTEQLIEFERTLACSPEVAFDAWTDPEQVSAWWDPTGAPLVSCRIELKVAGAFRFETKGHAPPFVGTYQLLDRPRRLEFDALGAHGTVSFSPRGAQTLMRVTIRSPSAEHFETFLKLGVDQGTAKTLDNMVAFVAQR